MNRYERCYRIEYDFQNQDFGYWPIHNINKTHVWEVNANESIMFKEVNNIAIK